jgi:phosphatidate cytidylyltransferase
MAVLATAIASFEYANLVSRRFVPVLGAVLVLASAQGLVELLASWGLHAVYGVAWALFLIGVLAAQWSARQRQPVVAEIGSLWFAAPLFAMVALHRGGSAESAWVWTTPLLLVLIPLWIGDTAAIFAGKYFGRRLMAPKISPKKTWEGGIANFGGCLLASLVVGWMIGVDLAVAGICGLLIGVLGQVGDLFQSSLKRAAGVKDSGALLPGHGGILDRIDSLLFPAIPVAWLLAYAVR